MATVADRAHAGEGDSGPALVLDGIVHGFGDLLVLDGVSVTVGPGELVAVIGPNGCGKTTLLSIAAGVLEPQRGAVSPEPSEIGWAPQQAAVYGRLTVRENLELFAGLERVEDREGAVQRMLELSDLAARAGDRVETLSGGNRQRVNIAVALVAGPPVLLLDEPSSSLDPLQRERLWQFIAGLKTAGTAVLFSTHYVAEAARHADRIVVLAERRVVHDLPPDALLARARGIAGDPAADLETALAALLSATTGGGA